MGAKDIPLPAPKPWLRNSADIISQAQQMMTPVVDAELIPLEDDPE